MDANEVTRRLENLRKLDFIKPTRSVSKSWHTAFKTWFSAEQYASISESRPDEIDLETYFERVHGFILDYNTSKFGQRVSESECIIPSMKEIEDWRNEELKQRRETQMRLKNCDRGRKDTYIPLRRPRRTVDSDDQPRELYRTATRNLRVTSQRCTRSRSSPGPAARTRSQTQAARQKTVGRSRRDRIIKEHGQKPNRTTKKH